METDFEKSTLQTTYSAKGKLIEVNTKFNVTEMSTETGTIVKCVKGNHWWLLVFTAPLLVYSALIYPIKNCKDKRKDHLRGLLMAKKRLDMEASQVKRLSNMTLLQQSTIVSTQP